MRKLTKIAGLGCRSSAISIGIGRHAWMAFKLVASDLIQLSRARAVGIGGRFKAKLAESSGLATAEYVITGCVFLALVIALGVFASRLEEGLFIKHAIDSASHSVRTNIIGAIGDVLLY